MLRQTQEQVFYSIPITRLEHFASLCLQGLLANPNLNREELKSTTYTELAVSFAECLIERLENANKPDQMRSL